MKSFDCGLLVSDGFEINPRAIGDERTITDVS